MALLFVVVAVIDFQQWSNHFWLNSQEKGEERAADQSSEEEDHQ